MNKFHALVACTLVASAPALANEKQVAVPYHDLSLTSASDREMLDSRLQTAATAVCAVEGVKPLERPGIIRRCKAAALADARHKAKIVVARANNDTQLAAR